MVKRKQPGIFFVVLCAAALILDGRCALRSASSGMELCIRTVIPSLFPFLFLSSLLTGLLWGSNMGFLGPLCRRLGIPAGAESLLIAGFLGGYPSGAQAIGDACARGALDKETGQRLLGFCNNAGPAFLFGMASLQFEEPGTVWLLWGIHILSALMTGLMTSGAASGNTSIPPREVSVTGSLSSAVRTMGLICGWILLFRVLLGFLERWFLWLLPEGVQVLVSGLLELSIGCMELRLIPSHKLRFTVCAAMVGFGGLCVAMQTGSAARGLSMAAYFRGKMLQTIFSIALSLVPAPLLPWVLAGCGGFILIFPLTAKNKGGNPKPSVV